MVPDSWSPTAPRFCPELTPVITTSGVTSMPPSRAQLTASAGKPATDVAGKPLAVCTSATSSSPSVVLEPLPLWFSFGATTTSSVSGSSPSARTTASMPGAA